MGNCLGSPADRSKKYEDKKPGGAKPRRTPDFGLGDQFEVIKLLGTGGEGETWLCNDNTTQEQVAIKLIRRPIPKAVVNLIKREIKIQADLGQGHLNIVHAREVVLSKSHLGLSMEFVSGGNMVSYVSMKRETRHLRGGLALDEDEARYFFRQLIAAVEFCHKNHVAHRDLKLDNTLLDANDPPRIKLCDFGFAKTWSANANMDTMRIGTPEYMGPELISSRHGYDGQKVDIWATGVLLFVMMLGKFPFEAAAEDDNQNTTAGLHEMWQAQTKTSWRNDPTHSADILKLSDEVKDLLDKMFEARQEARISIPGIKQHPWYLKPLLPKYQAALDQLNREQAAIDLKATSGAFRNKNRDKALEALLTKASQPAVETDGPVRLPLSGLHASFPSIPDHWYNGAMPELPEEEPAQ